MFFIISVFFIIIFFLFLWLLLVSIKNSRTVEEQFVEDEFQMRFLKEYVANRYKSQ